MGAPTDEVDLVVAAVAAGEELNAQMLRRLAAAGHPQLRFAHRELMRLVADAPLSITAIAGRLGVTQQAVSKRVAELERLAYVERRTGSDARVRLVGLTSHGLAARRVAVAARAEIMAALREELGPRRVDSATRLLEDLLRARGR